MIFFTYCIRVTPILFLYTKGLVLYGMKSSGLWLRGTPALLILLFSVDLVFFLFFLRGGRGGGGGERRIFVGGEGGGEGRIY